jgi:SHAQKYF class myb-like DNA-binding protein
MTISTRIRGELFTSLPDEAADVAMDAAVASPQLIRLPLTRPPDAPTTGKKKKKSKKVTKAKHQVKVEPSSLRHGLPWTTDEHDRFLQGLEQFPSGPWKAIAAFVGTRTPRQTMTHAQKYRQKIQRRRRGLLTSSRQPVPVTSELYCGLVITTSTDESSVSPLASKSPTAVDAALATSKQNIAPLESNWFDKVAVEELDAAFHAFLEVYDPTLFPMDDDEQSFTASLAGINNAAAFTADCNALDGASIVL